MGAFTSSGMFNPSAGAGMPGFQEGFQPELTQEQQNMIGNQTDMFTQSMQQPLPGYQLNTNTVFPGNQQQPMTQGDGQLPPGFGALSPIDRSQINPSASIGMTGGGFGGGKSFGRQLRANIDPAIQAQPITQPAPGQNPSVSIGMPIQQPNRFIPPNAPGSSARRPIPGIPFPGQTGLTRPRVAPQPMPINRFTRGRFR